MNMIRSERNARASVQTFASSRSDRTNGGGATCGFWDGYTVPSGSRTFKAAPVSMHTSSNATGTFVAFAVFSETRSGVFYAKLGISAQTHENQSGYITRWLEVMREDVGIIFTAASKANMASRTQRSFGHLEVGKRCRLWKQTNARQPPTRVCRAKRTASDLRRTAAVRVGPKPFIEPFPRTFAFFPGICSAEHPGKNRPEEVNHVLGAANGGNSIADALGFRLVFVFRKSHLNQTLRVPVPKNVAYHPFYWLTCRGSV